MKVGSDLNILWPKTVRLDLSMGYSMTPTWKKLERIGGTGQGFLHPGLGLLTSHIFNEDDAKAHLRDRILGPLRHMFDGLFAQAKRADVSTHPDDQALIRNLRGAQRAVIRGEDRRFVIQSPEHDEETRRYQNLDNLSLAEELIINPDAHVATRDAPNPQGHSLASTGGTELQLPFGRRVPDLTLNWYGRNDAENAGGGLPFFSLEVKDPNKLPPDVVHSHVTRFPRSFINAANYAEDIRVFQDSGVIPLRALLNNRRSPLKPEATAFWQVVARRYQSMFTSRQTFGVIASGRSGVGLRIDWELETEPGQRVYITLFNCETNVMTPPWEIPPSSPGESLEPNFVTFFACYAGQQLERRLVPMPTFDRAVEILAEEDKDPDYGEDDAANDGDSSLVVEEAARA